MMRILSIEDSQMIHPPEAD